MASKIWSQKSCTWRAELAIQRGHIAVITITENEISEATRVHTLSRADQETLQLALREQADWVLIDDLLARQTAHHLGLKVKGTLGVIVAAFRAGLLSGKDCEFLLQAILQDDDIWIDEGLVRQVQQDIQKRIRGG